MIFDLKFEEDVRTVQLRIGYEREGGKKVGITSGSFDLFHYFHLLYLERCLHHCDTLVVGIDSDRFIQETKGSKRPFVPEYKRTRMVAALRHVQFACVINGIQDVGRLAAVIQPDCIIRNEKFLGREGEVVGGEHAGEIVIVPDIREHSSTTEITKEIVRRLTEKES